MDPSNPRFIETVRGVGYRFMQEHLARHEGYEQARQRQAASLAEGFDLGTRGERSWTREDLHERG